MDEITEVTVVLSNGDRNLSATFTSHLGWVDADTTEPYETAIQNRLNAAFSVWLSHKL